MKVLWLFFGLIASVAAHSWLEHPIPRDYGLLGGGNEIDNEGVVSGCKYSYQFGQDNTYDSFYLSRVHRGSELCIRHAGNGHVNDPLRGYSRVTIGYPPNEETECTVLASNVDYSLHEGFKVVIPEDAPIGRAVIKWFWLYYGSQRNFTSCADILVVDDSVDLSNEIVGLPPGVNPSILGKCAPSEPIVYTALGNESPLLDDPECAGNGNTSSTCVPDLVFRFFDDPFRYSVYNTCRDSLPAETECYHEIVVRIETDVHSIRLVSESDHCHCNGTHECGGTGGTGGSTDGTDGGGTDGGTDGTGGTDCVSAPPGYCCTDLDCPGSYCKNYQSRFPNGYWVCQ